jgi:hypothetical protein
MAEKKEKKVQSDIVVQEVLLPVTATVVKTIEPVTVYESSPDVPKGQVLVCMVTPDGVEKPNTDFLIGQATYDKFYANNAGFRLKKKH